MEKGDVVGTAHSAVLPMLIILRSLRWSEKGEKGEIREVVRDLKRGVRPFLGSREWQVSWSFAVVLTRRGLGARLVVVCGMIHGRVADE